MAKTKEELELEKLALELKKIKADKEKIEIETEELKKPFFRKQAFLQTALIAFLTILVSGLGVAWTIYYGFKQIDLGFKQADKKNLENEYAELQKKNSEAIDKNKELEEKREDLDNQIANLDTQNDEQRKEKERLLQENKSIARESNEINKEKNKIDDELRVLTAKSVVTERFEQNRLNEIKQRYAEVETKYLALENRKIQLEQDVKTANVNGKYALLRYIVSSNLSDNFDSTERVVKEIRQLFDSDAIYRQIFENILKNQIQDSSQKTFALMLGYRVNNDQNLKNQLIELTNNYLTKNAGKPQDEDMFMLSILSKGFHKYEEEDVKQFIYFFVKFLKNNDEHGRRFYINTFERRLRDPHMTEYLDKDILLDLVEIIRADLQRGYRTGEQGNAMEILIQCNHVAYFSIAGKILAESEDEGLRSVILDRMSVVGWLGTSEFGLPGRRDKKSWENWVKLNHEVVDWWNEFGLKTLRRDNTIFQRAIKTDVLKKLPN